MPIKTINSKVVNYNKSNVLGKPNELSLRSNKDIQLSGTDVIRWSDIKNGWIFHQPTPANRPIYNTTEKAIEFTSANNEYLVANKYFDYSKPFQLSFWLKIKTFTSNQCIMSQYRGSDVNYFYVLTDGVDNIIFLFRVSSITYSLVYSGLINNTWYHITILRNNLLARLYVNGVYEDLAVIPTTSIETSLLWFGNIYSFSRYFNGYIDDLIIKYEDSGDISSIASINIPVRQSYDTTPILQLQANTLADQKILLDGSNNVLQWSDVRNKSYFRNDVGNNPSYNFVNQAIEFTASNSEYLINNSSFDYSQSFMISFWIKFKTNNDTQRILTQWDYPTDSNNFFRCVYITNFLSIDIRIGGSYGLERIGSGANIIADTNWHYILYLHSKIDQVQCAYIDGFPSKCYTGLNVTSFVNLPFYMGTLQNIGSGYFNGFIDDLKITRFIENSLVNWTGTALKYTPSQQVFTPKSRNFPNL